MTRTKQMRSPNNWYNLVKRISEINKSDMTTTQWVISDELEKDYNRVQNIVSRRLNQIPRRKRKKGSLYDIWSIVAVVVFLAFLFPIMYHIGSAISTGLDDSGEFGSNNFLSDIMSSFIARWQGFFVLLLFTILIVGLVLAWNVYASPGFLPLGFIALVIMTYFAMKFSNVYSAVLDSGTSISTSMAAFGIITVVMVKLPFIVFGAGLLILAALYAKPQGGNL